MIRRREVELCSKILHRRCDRLTVAQTPSLRSQMPDFAWKLLIILAVVAAALALAHSTSARNYLGNIQNLKFWLLSLGWVGPAAGMGIVFVLVATGTPRLLFCPIGGLAFGFWQGLLWTQVATLAGSYALFLFVRWGGRDFVLRHWPRVGRLKEHFHGHSEAILVFAVRQLPITGLIIDFLLGLSPIQHRHFLLGTAFGILPEAIPLTLAASGFSNLTGGNIPLYTVAATGVLLLVFATLWYFSHHSSLLAELRNKTEAPEEAGVPPPSAP